LRSSLRKGLSILLLAAACASPAAAGVFHSQKEAIDLAFPDATSVEKKTHILSDEQTAAVEERARSKLESRLVSVYTGWREDDVLGYAIIDIHTVRTQPEAFMVVVAPDGKIRSLRVLAFYEPGEYLPPERWLRLFDGKPLDERLHLRADVHGIAGSTLTARAVTSGVRRALALVEVLVGKPGGKPGAAPAAGL
jgi:Na+-translocating ferredoxin:NAD+ oxidoreductase RnfG subunit